MLSIRRKTSLIEADTYGETDASLSPKMDNRVFAFIDIPAFGLKGFRFDPTTEPLLEKLIAILNRA